MQGSENIGKRAAALATWIVIQAVERNPEYFSDETKVEEFETCLQQSFGFVEQARYGEALAVVRNFLGKLSKAAPHIFQDDPELFEAVGTLSQLDSSFQQRQSSKLFGFIPKIW